MSNTLQHCMSITLCKYDYIYKCVSVGSPKLSLQIRFVTCFAMAILCWKHEIGWDCIDSAFVFFLENICMCLSNAMTTQKRSPNYKTPGWRFTAGCTCDANHIANKYVKQIVTTTRNMNWMNRHTHNIACLHNATQ